MNDIHALEARKAELCALLANERREAAFFNRPVCDEADGWVSELRTVRVTIDAAMGKIDWALWVGTKEKCPYHKKNRCNVVTYHGVRFCPKCKRAW